MTHTANQHHHQGVHQSRMSGLRHHLCARHSSLVRVSLIVPISAGAIVLGVAGPVAVVHVVVAAALALLRLLLREQVVVGRVPILHLVVIILCQRVVVVVAVVSVVAVPGVVEVPFDVGTFDASTVD
eukprot:scaffold92861_cov45-Phaeocystis_antarctica.AAC.1